jgi:virulence-associated protein VapD
MHCTFQSIERFSFKALSRHCFENVKGRVAFSSSKQRRKQLHFLHTLLNIFSSKEVTWQASSITHARCASMRTLTQGAQA